MAQNSIGPTSYKDQSLNDILEDVEKWITCTSNKKTCIIQLKKKLLKSNFWDKVPYDFQNTILSTISYFDTILYDLGLIKEAISKNCITEKEVKLLKTIGQNAEKFDNEYNGTYKKHGMNWHEYGNPDFAVVEEIYKEGRNYFVLIKDAENAASRLEDYMKKGQSTNYKVNVNDNNANLQIQQGTFNSSQKMLGNTNFDYDKVLEVLNKIKKTSNSNEFEEDFKENSDETKKIIAETIEMVKNKDEPSKIKKTLTNLKELAVRVTGSIIATGISGMIKQLPIW